MQDLTGMMQPNELHHLRFENLSSNTHPSASLHLPQLPTRTCPSAKMAAFITLKFKKNANKAAYKEYVTRAASSTTLSPRSRARVASGRSSAAISKSSDGRGQSLKLTVKTAPSKLREVMRANEIESLHDTLGGGQVIEGSRRRRNAPPPRASARAADRPKYAEFGESDLEDEDEDEDEEDPDEDMDDDVADEEDDVEMDDAPMPPKAPKITLKPPAKSNAKQANPKLLVTPANVGTIKSVEDQEMQDDPGDDEVEDSSDLSDDEEEGDQTNLNEDDAPGEEDEMENEEDAAGEDDDLDEDDSDSDSSETPASGAATPDPAQLTKRQRRAMDGEQLMALEMGPQQRKVSTTVSRHLRCD